MNRTDMRRRFMTGILGRMTDTEAAHPDKIRVSVAKNAF